MLEKTTTWLYDRLHEASTYRGIVIIVTAIAMFFRVALYQEILTITSAILGIIETVRIERNKNNNPQN